MAIPSPGMSEPELRKMETAVLGPEHAAEHAEQRAMEERASELGVAGADAARSAGDGVTNRVSGPPAQIGQWDAPFSIPIFGIHAVMLPTGKVMWWAYPFGDGEPRREHAQAWLWNPATGAMKRVDPPVNPQTGQPANIWCSGQSLLADGRVLVTGGNLAYGNGTPRYRLEGPQQGLHVQPLQRDLDPAARYASRALVPEPGAAARRTRGDHGRVRRDARTPGDNSTSTCSRRART